MNRITKALASGAMALALTAGISVATVAPANAEPNCKQDTTYLDVSKPLPVGNLVCGYSGNDTGRMLYADRVAAYNYASKNNQVAARTLMIKDITAVTLTMASSTYKKSTLMGLANQMVDGRTTTTSQVNKVYTILMYHAQYYGANIGAMNNVYKIAKIISDSKYTKKLAKAAGFYSIPFLEVYVTAVFESQDLANYIGNTSLFPIYYDRVNQI
jgi:hypothetical protein